MDIQIKRHGKDVLIIDANNVQIESRVCIYFDRETVYTTGYIKSDGDLSQCIMIFNDNKYQIGKSNPTNSAMYRSVITPIAEDDHDINFDVTN